MKTKTSRLFGPAWAALAIGAICCAGCDTAVPNPPPPDSVPPEQSDFRPGLVAENPMTEDQLARFKTDNEDCLVCHETATPKVVEDYMFSNKAKIGLKCVSCHPDDPDIPDGLEGHRKLPTPEICGACHENQYRGHRENRHSLAYIRMLECGRYDDFPREYGVGSGFHFNAADVAELAEFKGSTGQTHPTDYTVMTASMCGPCHNVENRCDSCHFRHRFSTHEARSPEGCATCHMGPDHPQIEMYEHSKHGAREEVYGDTPTVPTCVDCHMPYNVQMLGKKVAPDGTEYTDHNLAMGIAYGPIGGGTTRKGQTLDPETMRVRFKSRDSDAVHEELWLERSDEKIYDAPSGGNVVFENLLELGIADASSNGKQDYVVDQPADPPETLEASREFMQQQVCGQCHTQNFAAEQLLTADLIHENSRTMQLEAFDMVRGLALASRLHVNVDQRPGNPETGTTGLYGANMLLRNLDTIESLYFRVLKYDVVKSWKGAYHSNPDYTHWYGWQELSLHVNEIASEATDMVMLDLWMRDLAYPGESRDFVEDGLWQGVIFEIGSQTNLYDKYPGPGDPGADEPIDVDMDGVPEFNPVEGSPGTFIATDGTEITFH